MVVKNISLWGEEKEPPVTASIAGTHATMPPEGARLCPRTETAKKGYGAGPQNHSACGQGRNEFVHKFTSARSGDSV